MDWDRDGWRLAGQRFLDLAAEVSTGWDKRPPFPVDGTDVRVRFREGVPQRGVSLDRVLDRLANEVAPLSSYNGHPRWFGYITGSPLPVSVVADLAASALNQNMGLWRIGPAATAIELQTIDWIKEIVGFPDSAEGIFVSGGQMANIVAQAVFRDTKAPWDIRRFGARGPDGAAVRLRIYASSEAHYCHEQAADLLGLGREAIRYVPADNAYRMRPDALRDMIDEDKARGDLPVAVIASAGTVGTGAIDPLGELQAIARERELWFHVDGAYGAFAALAANCPPELKELARADSIACDPHKWLYQPIDAGVVLVREPGLLERSFAFHAPYLETEHPTEEVDMVERSPENTRPFRALKVWVALQVLGTSGFAEMIERNIVLAAEMERLVEETDGLVLAAPRELSIVCWRVEPTGPGGGDLERLQTDVIDTLQARGIAVVSNAKLKDGRAALRACIVNFRTTEADVRAVIEASAAIGRELASTG